MAYHGAYPCRRPPLSPPTRIVPRAVFHRMLSRVNLAARRAAGIGAQVARAAQGGHPGGKKHPANQRVELRCGTA